MKKAGFAIALLCLAGLFANLTAQKRPLVAGVKWEGFEESQRKAKAAKEQINTLFAGRQYDSVINYCNTDQAKKDLWYDDLEMALTTAYWYKGDKTAAYQYVQKCAAYDLTLNGGGGHPFQMLYNYDFGDAIPTDTFLEQIIINKVSDYYMAMSYYPDRSTGLKLMLMDYKLQKLLHRHIYNLSKDLSPDQKEALVKQYYLGKEEIEDQFVALLMENGRLFTRHDIGPADEKQYSIIRNLQRAAYFALIKPLVYSAMLADEASPDVYVEILVAEEKIKDKHKDLTALTDSLCWVYKCKRSKVDSMGRIISYATGDTIYLPGKDTAYIEDNQGQPMKGIGKPGSPRKPGNK